MLDEQKRKDAIRSLINIAMFEGVVLVGVIGVYLATDNITYLIGGVIGSTIIFAPMFLRWFKDHGRALKAKPNSAGGANG